MGDAGATLFDAIHSHDGRVVRRLLEGGASPDSRDAQGSTVLYVAAVAGAAWIVGELLAGGASPDLISGGDGEGTPLCGAACWGHRAAVAALLAGGADPNAPEADGFTPLLWAAHGGWDETVSHLLNAGAKAGLAGPGARTPLHAAAERGALAIAQRLLDEGASPAAKDDEGRTPLSLAEAWAGKDVEAELGRRLLETAGAGSTIAVTRRTVYVEVSVPGERGGVVAERECGHAEIASLLRAQPRRRRKA